MIRQINSEKPRDKHKNSCSLSLLNIQQPGSGKRDYVRSSSVVVLKLGRCNLEKCHARVDLGDRVENCFQTREQNMGFSNPSQRVARSGTL